MEQERIPPGSAGAILFFLGAEMGLFIYCIVLGSEYPTDGGCTSADNGNLPNRGGLDFAWWFKVYGAVGITLYLFSICSVMGVDNSCDDGTGSLLEGVCSIPLQVTHIVFFIIGNVCFFYFTPGTIFSNEVHGESYSILTSTPSSSFTHSDNPPVITDGIHAANCQWLGLNGFWMIIAQWLSVVGLCVLMCLCTIICIPFQNIIKGTMMRTESIENPSISLK